jgi:hypothetical protein
MTNIFSWSKCQNPGKEVHTFESKLFTCKYNLQTGTDLKKTFLRAKETKHTSFK